MGGIERALISLLEAIPKDNYAITVLVMGSGGELSKELENVEVKCLFGDDKSIMSKLINCIKSGRFSDAYKTIYYTSLSQLAKSVFKQEMYYSKMLLNIQKEYDIAIAYHTPASFPVIYVHNNIRAKRKVAWIHSDVSKYIKELEPYKEYYDHFNKIFCVSKYRLNKFVEAFPHLKERVSVFYNLINQEKINFLSKEKGFVDKFNGVRILTIGRLTEEKGQDIIPHVISKSLEKGHNIKWYCIGDGELRYKLENLIKKYNLEERLILLGTKNNPYPYLKQCEIYVQPSRHEGFCISLAEARIINKTILATDFVGAKEQINDNNTGMIVKFDKDLIYKKLDYLLENKNFCQQLEKNLSLENKQINNDIDKLLALI